MKRKKWSVISWIFILLIQSSLSFGQNQTAWLILTEGGSTRKEVTATQTTYSTGIYGKQIGRKVNESNQDVFRSVIYFNLTSTTIPENSVLKSVKLTYSCYGSGTSKVVTLSSKDVPVGQTNEQWFTKIQQGDNTILSTVENDGSTTTHNSDPGQNPILFNLINSNYQKSNVNDRFIAIGVSMNNDNSATDAYIYSVTLDVVYEPHYLVTIKNSFNSGSIYVDDGSGTGFVAYNSGKEFNWVVGKMVQVKSSEDLTLNNVWYAFTSWTSNKGGTKTVNPFSLTVSKDETWTANFDQKVKIIFKNQEGNINLDGSKLKVGGEDNVSSGEYRFLANNSTPTILTKHETWDNNRLKHNNWNDLKSEYKLSHLITATQFKTDDCAKFSILKPATITPSLDGVPVTGSVEIKDPWFVEADGTQQENWKSYPTGFTPSTMPNGGVFLNEGGSISNLGYPFYSTRITYSQTTLAGTDAYFQNWSGPAGSIASPTSLETAVIFKSANDVIKANYKGHLRTGAPEKADQKNQRRSDGFLTVYESMGEIWLTQVDGYGNWSPEIRLSFGTGTAKNPSLSNWVPVYSGSKAIISWLENGQVFFQPVRYSNSGGPVSFSWDNQSGVREYNSRPGLSTDSRPVATLYLSGSGLDVWYAYEANTGGIESGRIVLADSYSSPFMSGLYRTLSGFVSGTTKISTGAGDQYPVLINQPAASGFAAKKAIYFLAGGYAAGKRIAEYNLANEVTTVFPVNNSEYTFTSLSGGVNPTSASYTLVAAAQRNLSGGVISYDTEIYQKASYYSVTSLPSLSKIYSNATNPVVMVDNTPYIGSPVYEVNFKQGTNWYKANGGSALTLIGTNIAGIFSSEQVGSGTRKSVVVKTNTSPASLVFYSGTGVLNKGEGTLYADVRSVRNYVTLNGQSKTAILDFAGALVEPVDSLENGSSICAVKLIAPDQNTIIVRQPDSIKTALAIDLIRNGVSVRSYSASLWDELSINSFEDVQDGDVLVFRLGFPVASSWGYEIYDFNGTSLTKNEEEAADAVKLKKLENGVLVYPNPFNPNTRISVSLEAPASVKVMVFNILGQLVSDFGKADLGAGVHTYAFDGKSLASGTYFYRVEIGEKVKTGKLQLLK